MITVTYEPDLTSVVDVNEGVINDPTWPFPQYSNQETQNYNSVLEQTFNKDAYCYSDEAIVAHDVPFTSALEYLISGKCYKIIKRGENFENWFVFLSDMSMSRKTEGNIPYHISLRNTITIWTSNYGAHEWRPTNNEMRDTYTCIKKI